ncbi:MAG: cysteine hydrolase family protein [Gammaproteobacteria bacterium]
MENYIQANFKTSAVISIDTQCDTLDDEALEIPGTSAAVPNIRRLLDVYRQHKMPIIHVVRIYKPDGSNVDLCRKQAIENGDKIFLQGSRGCELAPGMFEPNSIKLDTELLLSGKVQTINTHEVILYKPRWGAFFNTPLESHLKNLGVDTLVFVGCNFPNCPRTSIYEASERDFRIVLVADAMSGVYPKGIEEMRDIGVVVENTLNVVDAVNV